MSDSKNQPDTTAPAISILCVEDEPITRQFLSTIISMKYPEQKVYTADNGQEGLKIFREVGVDVVLTDISMPVMDGIRMAREIRQDKPQAFIIALSAHNSLDCQPEEQETLFNAYLRKPISGELLCDAIDQCIAGIVKSFDVYI
jgi:YesN/AraC family two-component response regulator